MPATADTPIDSPNPAPTHLSLRASGRSDAEFGLWRWALSPLFDADAASPEQRPDFEFLSHNYLCRRMSLGTVQTSAARYRRRNGEIARGGHDQIMVMVYERGSYELRANRSETLVRAGDVAIFDLGRDTELLATPSTSMVFLLPRDSLEPLTASLDHVHGMIIPAGQDMNGLLKMHMRFLLAHADGFSESQTMNLVQSMTHLLAAGIGAVDPSRQQTAEAVSAARLRQMCKTIDANLANPELGPDYLAKLFRTSRASLYRMFEPLGGISAHVQRRRLMRAHRDLVDPALFHERVSVIAQLWGFPEQAAFSRAYKHYYGMQPTEARARARQAYPAMSSMRDPGAGSLQALNKWLTGSMADEPKSPLV